MITTEQELLDAYITAELGVIGEFSSSISTDARKLKAEMRAYAERHGLTFNAEPFDAYEVYE